MWYSILDLHRGTVDLLLVSNDTSEGTTANLEFSRLFEITVHLNLDSVKLEH